MQRVEITKLANGTGLLRCTRQDGSVTWQKQDRHAAHFALRDLTHFAVKTVLRCRRVFFGLIAEGWGIEELADNFGVQKNSTPSRPRPEPGGNPEHTGFAGQSVSTMVCCSARRQTRTAIRSGLTAVRVSGLRTFHLPYCGRSRRTNMTIAR